MKRSKVFGLPGGLYRVTLKDIPEWGYLDVGGCKVSRRQVDGQYDVLVYYEVHPERGPFFCSLRVGRELKTKDVPVFLIADGRERYLKQSWKMRA